MPDLNQITQNMLIILKQIETYQDQVTKIKQGKIDKNQLNVFQNKIKELYNQLEKNNQYLTSLLEPVKAPVIPKPIEQKVELPKTFDSAVFRNLTKEEQKKLIKDLGLTKYDLKWYLKQSKKAQQHFEKQEDYTIYKPNQYGEFANKYMKEYSLKLQAKYPKLFEPLFDHIRKVNINILSTTYVSIMLFFTIVAFPGLLIFFTLLNLTFKMNFIILTLLALLATIGTFFTFYFYPGSLIAARARNIKNELPFALVHMSAVAGSGANPISIFELIAESDEYVELKKEVKKIMNFVNLFGYNLSTSLKNVSKTTPSPEFKEVLEGLISSIETGGNVKDYLNEKAADALRQYQQRRKKQVEALATFSDVYTALLIAAPLLLIVTLAIINTIGGKLAGFDVKTIAAVGVYGLIPLMNLGFMAFLKISQPDL